MPKSAVINVAREGLLETFSFKKMALLFDDLYINERDFHFSKIDIEFLRKADTEQKKAMLSELDWLLENNIIRLYDIKQSDLSSLENEDALSGDVEAVNNKIKENLHPVEESEQITSSDGSIRFMGSVCMTNDLIFQTEDIRMRIAAAVLGRKNSSVDFVPIVNSLASYQQQKSLCSVAHFVLEQLPVPDENTPWEQVLDFRADAEVKRQYHSLLNWINQVGRKEQPLSYLIDEYNHLYSQYLNQYSLHKMNSRLTTMELLVTAGIDFISSITQQGYVSAFKDLLTIRKKQVALLKEEKDIEGRELAYIFSAVQQFK